MKNKNVELIFVYNADSGKLNAYMDMLHKIFSPKTYPCSLCAITYGVFSINQEWEKFIAEQSVPMLFLHRDEWEYKFYRADELPAVFVRQNDDISVLIDSKTMNKLSLDELMKIISDYQINN